jgi:hypothetical protein
MGTLIGGLVRRDARYSAGLLVVTWEEETLEQLTERVSTPIAFIGPAIVVPTNTYSCNFKRRSRSSLD